MASSHPYPYRFSVTRQRTYAGLLVFIVIIGLPIVAVPYLRNRLSERVFAIKAAISGEIKPAVAQAGANPEGFPKEYETAVPAGPQIPPLPAAGIRTYAMVAPGLITSEIRKPSRRLQIPNIRPKVGGTEASTEQTGEEAAHVAADEPASTITFQQGSGEKDAYTLLLRSNTAIAQLVKGSNPSLHFMSWDAAHKGEDVYLVRLRFQSDGNPDVEYIWEVKLQTSEVIPLSYNAKSIS
jgi:hypothetical protein